MLGRTEKGIPSPRHHSLPLIQQHTVVMSQVSSAPAGLLSQPCHSLAM